MSVQNGGIYDHPKYYDLAYGSDWKAEVDFLEFCFKKYATHEVEFVFEPACGTGRLLIQFAKRGYQVGGIDLNENAVNFCNRRLARKGFTDRVFVGDMVEFEVPRQFDAAFNTINSFRHLQTDEQAYAHLRCMSDILRSGGIYILGIHLLPDGEPVCSSESWSSSQGFLTVNTQMWLIELNREQRHETFRLQLDIHKPTGSYSIREDIRFRTYSKSQILELIEREGHFDIIENYDFSYEQDEPVEIDEKTEDVVMILRKK
jgi:SAM-dependent methyltransferase